MSSVAADRQLAAVPRCFTLPRRATMSDIDAPSDPGSATARVQGVPALARSLRRLRRPGTRILVGIAGPPGAGKSHVADALCADEHGLGAVVVPMDGFHLASDVLAELGLSDVKGRPDTFDVGGFVALLERLRTPGDGAVYAPRFDRERDEALAGAVRIGPHVDVVIVEGNYLLLDDGDWCRVRPLLDVTYYLDVPPSVCRRRLLARQGVGHGDHGAAWVERVDLPNAAVVEATKHLADVVVALDDR
jgi:pantothenate kinase